MTSLLFALLDCCGIQEGLFDSPLACRRSLDTTLSERVSESRMPRKVIVDDKVSFPLGPQETKCALAHVISSNNNSSVFIAGGVRG